MLKRHNRGKIAIMMDKLAAHRSHEVRDECMKMDITRIFNVGYSPEFNPIEGVFSQVKRFYCRVRLQKLANDVVFDQTTWIRKAFAQITREVVSGCVRKSMGAL